MPISFIFSKDKFTLSRYCWENNTGSAIDKMFIFFKIMLDNCVTHEIKKSNNRITTNKFVSQFYLKLCYEMHLCKILNAIVLVLKRIILIFLISNFDHAILSIESSFSQWWLNFYHLLQYHSSAFLSNVCKKINSNDIHLAC